jgi:hypothetical protein
MLMPLKYSYVVRVEVAARGEVLGGVELDALAQVEGVFQAVLGDVPGLGQRRADGCRAGRELGQLVEDLPRGGIEGGARGIERGVEALRAALRAVDQGLGLNRAGQADDEAQAQRGRFQIMFHDFFSLWF